MSQPPLVFGGTVGWRRVLGASMRRVLFVGVAFAAFAAGPAIAADMSPIDSPAPAPARVQSRMPTMAPYDWTGFFFGVNGDYGRAKYDRTAVVTATGALDVSSSVSISGFHGGGQVGFDYMLPARVVVGFVANVSTGDDNIVTIAGVGNTHTLESKNTDSGSVRARLGYAFANVLVYGTGGWAWTD